MRSRLPAPAPIRVKLVVDIPLLSGRRIPAGTVLLVVPHPRQLFHSRPAYLARQAFESNGFPCDLTVFVDEAEAIDGIRAEVLQ